MKATKLEVFKMQFDVDTPQFLKEAAENNNGGMYGVCWNIFRNLLAMVAVRASELNDPILNVLMLRLNLYDLDVKENNVRENEKISKNPRLRNEVLNIIQKELENEK